MINHYWFHTLLRFVTHIIRHLRPSKELREGRSKAGCTITLDAVFWRKIKEKSDPMSCLGSDSVGPSPSSVAWAPNLSDPRSLSELNSKQNWTPFVPYMPYSLLEVFFGQKFKSDCSPLKAISRCSTNSQFIIVNYSLRYETAPLTAHLS